MLSTTPGHWSGAPKYKSPKYPSGASNLSAGLYSHLSYGFCSMVIECFLRANLSAIFFDVGSFKGWRVLDK